MEYKWKYFGSNWWLGNRDYKDTKKNLLCILCFVKPRESFLWWIDWNFYFLIIFGNAAKFVQCTWKLCSFLLLLFCVIFNFPFWIFQFSFTFIEYSWHWHQSMRTFCLVLIFTMTNSRSSLLDWFSLLTRGVHSLFDESDSSSAWKFMHFWLILTFSKYLLLCSTANRNSYRFGMTLGWFNDDNFHFWVNYLFKLWEQLL